MLVNKMLNCLTVQSDTSQADARVKPISKTSLFCPWLKLATLAIDKKNSVMHRIPVSWR